MTSGLTYSSVRSVFDKSGIVSPIKKTTFYNFQESLIPWLSKERNVLFDERIRRATGRKVRISVDGRWSSPKQALEGTVTCFDADSQEILDVQHVG